MTALLRANDQSARPRERRNWKLRPFSAITLRRGPVQNWTAGVLVLALLAAFLVWRYAPSSTQGAASIAYSDAAQALSTRQVATLTVTNDGARLVLTLRQPRIVNGNEVRSVETIVPARAVSLADLERWGAAGTVVRVIEPHASTTERIIQFGSLLLVAMLLIGYTLHHRGALARDALGLRIHQEQRQSFRLAGCAGAAGGDDH